MSGKKLLLKYYSITRIIKTGETSMDLGAYFVTLQYVLMATTFIVLVLIFLYTYYGKEEEQTNDKT